MNETNIELQLIQINKKLDKITNPFRLAGSQFISGLFHSLGNIFSMILITVIVYYIITSLNINLTQVITKYLQSLVPKPQFTIQSPF